MQKQSLYFLYVQINFVLTVRKSNTVLSNIVTNIVTKVQFQFYFVQIFYCIEMKTIAQIFLSKHRSGKYEKTPSQAF